MSSLKDRQPHTYLLVFYCVTLFCIYGAGQDISPPCEVGLMVRRGTTWTSAPRQRVTVKCPVKDCGKSVSVTWCKLSDTNRCELINHTESVQQNDKRVGNELISFLTFKRISIHDAGLYGCSLKGYKFEVISHTINISVSDVSPPCEVGLMVRRGMTWTAAPRQRVTVTCPVKDCGESFNVTWCKLSDTNRCERIHYTENVQQNDKRVKDELISFLTFKRISIHDAGLYGCSLKGYKFEVISHTINISVSDVSPPCEVGLMVRRGTTWTAAPRQRVTVTCPIKDCRESFNVTWCKLSDTDRCERIHYTENVQQNDKRVKDELISFLTFKRISIHDAGLYGCSLKGYKFEVISHTINISVSDSYQGVKKSIDTTDLAPSVAGDEDLSQLAYVLCLSVALLYAH
ncbi:uncharacterized protein LOC115587512 isoform X2 [Sparus aurata]|uniref:uncharacterized protein LOC115587512 isoform X2 n=1 Tax=Sparus aurata TaxID=8175 RepID=UPI0011C19520|nr:uncharacterized protein LOC115587512 isoform X2 [Sparus aurata]